MTTIEQALSWLRAMADRSGATNVPDGVDWHESAQVLLDKIKEDASEIAKLEAMSGYDGDL